MNCDNKDYVMLCYVIRYYTSITRMRTRKPTSSVKLTETHVVPVGDRLAEALDPFPCKAFAGSGQLKRITLAEHDLETVALFGRRTTSAAFAFIVAVKWMVLVMF